MQMFGRDVLAATTCPRSRVTRRDREGKESRPWVYRGLILNPDQVIA
jgi:hypothetical protein